MAKTAIKRHVWTLNFSYPLYNFILTLKFFEVTIKEFIKFVLLSNDTQKRRFFWERLSILSNVTMSNGGGRWVWIHANAIGEVNACQSLIRLIKDKYPGKQILLTTSNFSADKRATQLNLADRVIFFPYDIPFIIRRYLKMFRPVCVIVIECDIWPNFVKICKNEGTPVLVISGTFPSSSTRSLGVRYLYNYRFRLSGEMLGNIDCFCMQSEDGAKRLISLVPGHKNISAVGNLKFDYLNGKSSTLEKSYYQGLFNIRETVPVFVAGNVHPGEDEMVIEAFKIAKEEISDAVMILAPRFLKDISCIEPVLIKKGLSYIRKTALERQQRNKEDVILLDTFGELAKIYSVAKVAFVGGSLIYLGEIFGGHNILEPAQFGIPVMFGPYMHNFQTLADLFLRERAGVQVRDVRSLADNVSSLIKNEAKRTAITLKTREVFKANENVAEQTFARLRPFLESGGSSEDYPLRCEVCGREDFKFIIRQDKYKIFRCKNCCLVFSHPIPSEEELDEFYQNFSYNEFESMFAKENEQIAEYVMQGQLNLLRRLGADISGGRFLDIGCGNGYYLYGAKAAGFEAFGVEKDKSSAESAEANYGVKIFSRDLEDCGFPDEFFDIIKMRHVIEHLRYPNEYLREVYRILKRGGVLIVETPNTGSLETIPRLYFLDAFKKLKIYMPQLSLRRKLFLSLRREWKFTDPPRHLYGFSKANMERLLSANGFLCLKTQTAAMGDKLYFPISDGFRNFLRNNEKEARKRLYKKSKVRYILYRLIFKPAMEVLKLYIKLFGLGSHLVVHARKD